jgi:23S rRNA pseudouridine2605 synthase
MSRRRSFPAEGPRSRTPSQSRGPHAGGPKSRPRPVGAPGRDQSEPPRHEAVTKPRLFKGGGGAEPDKQDRLQKVLAHAGLGSRRGCEQLILQGRVTINGEVIRQLGTRVDPRAARITVDGEPIRLESMVYYAVNKPKGYVSTSSDPSGRPRVVDLLSEIPERVYTVGRLDEASTGLLILTNDGELANRLAHPRYGVEKVYRALVAGLATPEMLAKLTEGVWLSDGKVRAKRARIVGRQGQATTLELVLAEGKKREIRRMLSKLGHKVMALNRVAVGPISLKGLSVGECRSLSKHEIELLHKVAAGESVPLPRFFDGDSSSRSHGESRRPRRPDQPRSARNNDQSGPRHSRQNADGPRQRRPPHAQHENAPHTGSKRTPRSNPQHSPSVSPDRPSPAARPSRKGPGKPRPRPTSKAGKPNESRRANGSTPLPPEPLKPRRRIIGMDLESASRTGPSAPGAPIRKRPQVRKRRPPGPVLGRGRKSGSKIDRHEDEEG